MEFGSAESVAVGAFGGGGGGGGGVFFLQPLITIIMISVARIIAQCLFFTSCPPKQCDSDRQFYLKFLAGAPVRLCVAAYTCELLQVRSISQHTPDLFRPAARGFKDDVAAIRRP
jgi:hypothetical protein